MKENYGDVGGVASLVREYYDPEKLNRGLLELDLAELQLLTEGAILRELRADRGVGEATIKEQNAGGSNPAKVDASGDVRKVTGTAKTDEPVVAEFSSWSADYWIIDADDDVVFTWEESGRNDDSTLTRSSDDLPTGFPVRSSKLRVWRADSAMSDPSVTIEPIDRGLL